MKPETILRWLARGWGVASALLLCAFAFGGREHLRFTPGEFALFLLFPVGVVLGFIVAWFREFAGGLITVACLTIVLVYLSITSGRWPGLYFLLFAMPGFLHIASVLLASRRNLVPPTNPTIAHDSAGG